ncbi:MAG TPA: hypothetical protein DDW52_07830 [Planctomycetaceae bacterium]|nr:hypothetical protein [Planctomycetaceae bacterium]
MKIFTLAVFALTCLASSTAQAHFPWLTINSDGKAALFFGESVADQTYKLPESVAKAPIHAMSTKGKIAEVATSAVDSKDFVGLVSKDKLGKDNKMLLSKMTYGIYHGNRLNYYCMHVTGELPKQAITIDHAKEKGLYAEVTRVKEGVSVAVFWDGKPVEDTEVHLYCSEGHEEGAETTDKEGRVTFSEKEVEEGLNGIMFGITQDEEAGTLDGEDYKSAMHYATITFIAK